MAACLGNNSDEDNISRSTKNDNNMSSKSDAARATNNNMKTEINGEKAYDLVANYSEDELRDFLNCVTHTTKEFISNHNKTSSIAQILLERETAVLREESGSGDDSPDSSKHSAASRSTNKQRARLLNRQLNRQLSSGQSQYASASGGGAACGSDGIKSSAAARNTASSLGSLHDLLSADGGRGRGSGNTTSGSGGNRRNNQQYASGAHGNNSGVAGADVLAEDGHQHSSGQQRVSARARAGDLPTEANNQINELIDLLLLQ